MIGLGQFKHYIITSNLTLYIEKRLVLLEFYYIGDKIADSCTIGLWNIWKYLSIIIVLNATHLQPGKKSCHRLWLRRQLL